MTVDTPGIWAFDFDGTLSPLVADRHAAALDPACAALLAELAADSSQVVAVLSSRTLDDLRARVAVENLVLSGCSGMEWQVPGGQQLAPNQQASDRLRRERRRFLPSLRALQRVPGVELEDKNWSAAVHFRAVAAEDRVVVARELEQLRVRHDATLHYGPEVAEIQFLREVSKRIAVETLAKLYDRQETGVRYLFAGDDQNDAEAMRWVIRRRGTAFVVGDRLTVDGALTVPDPAGLAKAIRRRFLFGHPNGSTSGERPA